MKLTRRRGLKRPKTRDPGCFPARRKLEQIRAAAGDRECLESDAVVFEIFSGLRSVFDASNTDRARKKERRLFERRVKDRKAAGGVDPNRRRRLPRETSRGRARLQNAPRFGR